MTVLRVAMIVVVAAGCTGMDDVSLAPDSNPAALVVPAAAAEARDLAALRGATAGFHRLEVAQANGYDQQFPPGCFSSEAGGMGFHYLNAGLVGSLRPDAPQLLLYEPDRKGKQKLVGVEYLVPGSPTDPPPVLFGRQFHWHPVFEVWVLHVWVWRHNPAGLYEDWNPTVTCAHADVPAKTSSHH